jgi:FkbM family methyltransferase
MRIIKIYEFIIIILTISFYIKPKLRVIKALMNNKSTMAIFKFRNESFKIYINRFIVSKLAYLLKMPADFKIINLDNNEYIFLKYGNHEDKLYLNKENIEFLIEFKKLLNEKKISIRKIDKEKLYVHISELNTDIEGPISLLSGALTGMLSKKYRGTYYWDIDVQNKVVVDVGAFIGDSAIFFASRGAKVVYAYEPSKEFYEIAIKNCSKFNNIFLFNCALGLKPGHAYLTGSGLGKKIGNEDKKSEKVYVKSFSDELNKIINKEGAIDLLKLDCEGCE